MSLWNWCPEDPVGLGMHQWSRWSWTGKTNSRRCINCRYVERR